MDYWLNMDKIVHTALFICLNNTGRRWIKQMFIGAFMIPAMVCGTAFFINFIAIYYHASRAIPFGTMVRLTQQHLPKNHSYEEHPLSRTAYSLSVTVDLAVGEVISYKLSVMEKIDERNTEHSLESVTRIEIAWCMCLQIHFHGSGKKK